MIAKSIRPQVLVVTGERRPVLRQNQADAESPYELGIRKVLHDIANRPFAGRFWRCDDLWVQVAKEGCDRGRRTAKNDDRVLIAQQTEQRADVPSSFGGC